MLTATIVTKTQRNTGALVNSFCSLLHFAVQLGHFDLALLIGVVCGCLVGETKNVCILKVGQGHRAPLAVYWFVLYIFLRVL